MSGIQNREIGHLFKNVLAMDHDQIIAGGAKDNVAQNGLAIDRSGYLSCKGSVLVGGGTLASSQTATITFKLQDSADGSTDWQDFGEVSTAVVITNPTQLGIASHDIDLSGARKFVRMVSTIDLSAVSIDTVEYMGILCLGGAAEHPIT